MKTQITKQELLKFSEIIHTKCVENKGDLLKLGKGNWDTYVRKNFYFALNNWFIEYFKFTDVVLKNYIFVEGWNSIPERARGSAFFSTKMHPDAALILNGKPLVAIELDHGMKGSQIRNALSKAGFSVILGGFEKAIVLFFLDKRDLLNNLSLQTGEKKIFKFYANQLKTKLYFV